MKKPSLEYNGFTYGLDRDNNWTLEFNYKGKYRNLVKYYALSDYNINALINNQIFFSHALQLNDSFDSTPLLWKMNNCSEQEYFSFYKSISKSLFGNQLLTLKKEKHYLEDKKNDFMQLRYDFYQKFFSQRGIFSMTTNPMNILMWSHYTANKGFAIEFDNSAFINSVKENISNTSSIRLFPINYTKELEQIDLFKYKFKQYIDISVMYALSIKKKNWEYEDEWRIIYEGDFISNFPHYQNFSQSAYENYKKTIDDRLVNYNRSDIRFIYLGEHFINNAVIKETEFINNHHHIYYLRENSDENDDKHKINFNKLVIELANNYSNKLRLIGPSLDNKKLEMGFAEVDVFQLTGNKLEVKISKP